MLIKLWKDFKFLLRFLPILCFIFLFKINNVSALVYKDSINIGMNQNTFSGTISNGNNQVLNVQFNQSFSSTYDILVIKFGNLSYKHTIDTYNSYCLTYSEVDIGSGKQYVCSSYYVKDGVGITDYGNLYVQGALFYDNMSGQYKSSCYFTSELQDMMVCPINIKDKNIVGFEYNIRNGGDASLTYNITFNSLKYFYNYDSTEIVNGLNNVQQAQTTTATYIQNFNNYVSNTDTTQSNTNSTTALNGISSDFQQHLSGMNELTQFVFLPITFITSMIDSTCQPLIWDIPLVNTRVVVPCLSTIYSGYFGGIVGLFATVMSAFLTYRCVMKLLATIKGLLDAEDDKIEVLDL